MYVIVTKNGRVWGPFAKEVDALNAARSIGFEHYRIEEVRYPQDYMDNE